MNNKQFNSYNDENDSDENNSESFEYIGHLYISSVSDSTVLQLIADFIPDTLEIFKKRYLLSEFDYNAFMYDIRRIELYNYVYDEFEHVLHSKKYKKLLESEISNEDLDNIYTTLLDVIVTILDDDSEIDLDGEDDEEED